MQDANFWKRSGTEEDYAELERLMQEVSNQKASATSKSKKATEKKQRLELQGEKLRRAATAAIQLDDTNSPNNGDKTSTPKGDDKTPPQSSNKKRRLTGEETDFMQLFNDNHQANADSFDLKQRQLHFQEKQLELQQQQLELKSMMMTHQMNFQQFQVTLEERRLTMQQNESDARVAFFKSMATKNDTANRDKTSFAFIGAEQM